jgi:predicted DNA-binding transcriptional regulator AlpA
MAHLSPEKFREEAQRRLIDSFDVMILTGLRSREGIRTRIQSRQLPQPVYVKDGAISLWDRDEIEEAVAQRG